MICSMAHWNCWFLYWTGLILSHIDSVDVGPIGWLAFYAQERQQ
jgi:hypothetical protein